MTNEVMPARRKSWARDTTERVGMTFLMAFLAVYMPALLGGDGTLEAFADMSILNKAAFAGCAAVLSLIKALVARHVGNKESASIDPAV